MVAQKTKKKTVKRKVKVKTVKKQTAAKKKPLKTTTKKKTKKPEGKTKKKVRKEVEAEVTSVHDAEEVTDAELNDFFDDEYPEESDYDAYPREDNKAFQKGYDEE